MATRGLDPRRELRWWIRFLLAAVAWSGGGEMAAVGTPGSAAIGRALPRIEYQGGPYLSHPRIVTITFEGDGAETVARLRAFGGTITRSAWWHTATDGYCAPPAGCIGEGHDERHVQLAHVWPAAVRDVDVAGLLARNVKAGRFDPLDADTLLLVYLPAGVGLSDAFVPRYCDGGPRAFHRMLRLGTASVPFAVLPRCGSLAALTATASHEVLEAVTNPDPARRGFAFRRTSANAGFTSAGVEPVDPCGIVTVDRHTTEENGFVLQRAWSNRAAARGENPCVPTPAAEPYLALVPRIPTVRFDRPGERVTIMLDAAADRPVASWAVAAIDLTGRQQRQRCIDVALDRSTVAAGDTVRLTITARRKPPTGLCIAGVVSTLGASSQLWPVAAVMRFDEGTPRRPRRRASPRIGASASRGRPHAHTNAG